MQKHVFSLVGKAAKFAGKEKKWWKTGKLYWQGEEIDRFSPEYQDFLDEIYEALSKNSSFRKALLASGNAVLTHSIGKSKKSETILTSSEFCSRLMKIREKLKKEKEEIENI